MNNKEEELKVPPLQKVISVATDDLPGLLPNEESSSSQVKRASGGSHEFDVTQEDPQDEAKHTCDQECKTQCEGMQVIETHEVCSPNEEEEQELSDEYILQHVNEPIQAVPAQQIQDRLRAQFYIYIYDFKDLPMQKYYVELLCPVLSENHFYKLTQSAFHHKIFTIDIDIPKNISYKKLSFKIILISNKGKAFVSFPKAERYDSSLYTSSASSSIKNIFVFHTFQQIKNDFKNYKIKDASSYPYTQMACILIEKMFNSQSDPQFKHCTDVEKYIFKGFINEINLSEVYKTLSSLCRKHQASKPQHVWLYILEILYIVRKLKVNWRENNEALKSLASNFSLQPIGFLSQVADSFNDLKYEKFVLGMQMIINAYPIIGLQVLLDKDIVPDKNEQDRLIYNFKEDSHSIRREIIYVIESIHLILVRYVQAGNLSKGVLARCPQPVKMVASLVEETLKNCVKFEQALNIVDTFKAIDVNPQTIRECFEWICKDIIVREGGSKTKERADFLRIIQNPIKDRIDQNFNTIVHIIALQDMFKEYLYQYIYDRLLEIRSNKAKTIPFYDIYLILKKYPKFVTKDFLNQVIVEKYLFIDFAKKLPELIQLAQKQKELTKLEYFNLFSNLFKWQIGRYNLPAPQRFESMNDCIGIAQDLYENDNSSLVNIKDVIIRTLCEATRLEDLKYVVSLAVDLIIEEEAKAGVSAKKSFEFVDSLRRFIARKIDEYQAKEYSYKIFIESFFDENELKIKSPHLLQAFKDLMEILGKKYSLLTPQQLFEVPLFLILLQIRQNLPRNSTPFLEALAKIGSQFYQRLELQTITVKEVYTFFINPKFDAGNLEAILSLTVGDQYSQAPLKNVQKQYKYARSNLRITKKFFEWAALLGDQIVDLQNRRSQMEIYDKHLPSQMIKDAANEDKLSFMMKSNGKILESLEVFNIFSGSQIMQNIFDKYKESIYSSIFSIEEFNNVSMEKLFMNKSLIIFQEIFSINHDEPCRYEVLEMTLKNVKMDKLNGEIQRVKDFFHHIVKKEIDIKDQKLQYLRSYSQISHYLEVSKKYLKIEYLDEEIKEQDKYIKGFKHFVDFCEKISDCNPSMEKIHEEISTINKLLEKDLGDEHGVSQADVEIFTQSRILYTFCLLMREKDFNDLNQLDDDQQFIDYNLINNMNMIRQFLTNLHDIIHQCQQKSFDVLCIILKRQVAEQVQKDSKFIEKFQECIAQIDKFKSWYEAMSNTDENTLQVIHETLQPHDGGVISWEKGIEGKKYSVILSLPSFRRPINSELLIQHCGRALLMINPNDENFEQEQTKEKMIYRFVDIVKVSLEINDILSRLVSYGHYDFAKNHQQFGIIQFQISEQLNSFNDLKALGKKYLLEFENWKQSLLETRKKHYCLTFIPNEYIPQVMDFIEDPAKNYRHVDHLLKSLNKRIDYSFILSDMKLCGIVLEKIEGTIQQKLESYFSQLQNMINQIELNHSADEIFELNKEVQKSSKGLNFFEVDDEFGMIKEILSLYYINNQLPASYQIMFCEPSTSAQDLEIFILRALLNSNKKIFVLGNFQNLPLSMQLEYQHLINLHANLALVRDELGQTTPDAGFSRTTSGLPDFPLYTLFYRPSHTTDILIEVMQRAPKLQVGITLAEYNNKILTRFFSNDQILVVTASRTGLGKTQRIKDEFKVKKLNMELQYVRIPIYGDITKHKLAQLHNQENATNQKAVRAIHYDIYHGAYGAQKQSKKLSLNIIMFEILILNAINYGAGCLLNFDKFTHYYLEIADSINDVYNSSALFITLLPQLKVTWDIKEPEEHIREVRKTALRNSMISLDQNHIRITSKNIKDIQLVSRYLQAIQNNVKFTKSQIQFLQDPAKELQVEECQKLLYKNFLKCFANPNFYLLNSYVSLMAEQLKRLNDCPAFNYSIFFDQYRYNEEAQLVYKDTVQCMFKLAEKITKSQDSLQSQNFSLDKEADQVSRLAAMDPWSSNIQFILFNDGKTITPVYDDPSKLPQGIIKYFNQLNYTPKLYKDMTQEDFHDKILELCVENQLRKIELKEKRVLHELQITKDNFVKLALIHFRLRSKQPVILMGETGVGKTSLIEYLGKISERVVFNKKYQKMCIHAGVEETEIIEFVKGVQMLAKQYPTSDIIMFLDEINTNDNINGLIKEIIIDRHIQGKPIQKNICIVAACNPYKFKKDNERANRASIGLISQFHPQKQSRLVYQVHPLPEAMFSYIWDYGSLPQQEELEYITKIVGNLNKNLREFNQLEQSELAAIASLVSFSQHFTKCHENEWAVSLRDVNRFNKIFSYFTENNSLKLDSTKTYNPLDSYKMRALVLALSFCYYFRISDNEKRQLFLSQMEIIPAQMLIVDKRIQSLTPLQVFKIEKQYFERVLLEEQMMFINKMDIPEGIGINSQLTENVFAMIICILNRIPLFIIGKPGSSKSLSMNLVSKSLKGKCSKKQLFQQYPSVFTMMYQGSEQSTSKGIKEVFTKALEKQKCFDKKENKENQEMQALINFDELGLAANSPHNPLKVLHEILDEEMKVALIGISNYSLDASKMNRAITLQRPDPTQDDLNESAIKIATDINKQSPDTVSLFKEKYLQFIIKGYLRVIQNHRPVQFGLRDFYCAVKQISRNLVVGVEDMEAKNTLSVLQAIRRNFGGNSDPQVIMDYFVRAARELDLQELIDNGKWDLSYSQDLIRENLIDKKSRNLMIQTDCFSKTITYIQKVCKNNNKECKIFYGSDFPDDVSEESSYKKIKDIVLCMEKGIFCVLLNLESVYQSFYDMFNQNYMEVDGKLYCKIAIGSDSKNKIVHPDFKCVLLIEKKNMLRLDLPLRNRFEKQIFTDDLILTPEQQEISVLFQQWIHQVSRIYNFDETDAFPMINEDIMSGMVIHNYNNTAYNQDSEIILYNCKKDLMDMASWAGVQRMKKSNALDKEFWIDHYVEDGSHFSLSHLLQKQTKRANQYSAKGMDLIINYFESMTSDITKTLKECDHFKVKDVIQLNEVVSKDKFEEQVKKFLDTDDFEFNLLLIFVNPFVDKQRRLDHVISIIQHFRQKQRDNLLVQKHICLLIKIDFSEKGYLFNYDENWRVFTLDFLSYENNTGLKIDQVLNNSFMQILSEPAFLQQLIDSKVTEACSQIEYKLDQSKLSERIRKVREVIFQQGVIDQIQKLLISLIQRNHTMKDIDWIQEIVCDSNNQNNSNIRINHTLLLSAFDYFKQIIEKYLVTVIYCFEQNGLVKALNDKCKTQILEILPQVIDKDFSNAKPIKQYTLTEFELNCTFPFFIQINQEYNKLKDNFINDFEKLQQKYFPDEEDNDVPDEEEKSSEELKISELIKLKNSERELSDNISHLQQQVSTILPEQLKSNQQESMILQILDPLCFLENLSNYLYPNEGKHNFGNFIKASLEILARFDANSISFVYALYWRMEKMLNTAISFAQEASKIFDMRDIKEEFVKSFLELMQQPQYNQYTELRYGMRIVYVHALLKTFHSLFYPTDMLFRKYFLDENQRWDVQAKACLDVIKSMASQYSLEAELELQQIDFLVQIYQIFNGLKNQKHQIVLLADRIRDLDIQNTLQFYDSISAQQPQQSQYKFQHQIFRFFYDCRHHLDQDKKQAYFKALLQYSTKKFIKPLQNKISNEVLIKRCRIIHYLVNLVIQDGQDQEEYIPNIFMQIQLESAELKQSQIPLLQILMAFDCVKKKSNITEESPFIIALTDEIEKSFAQYFEFADHKQYLQQAINDLIKDTNIIKKAMSVAYFRKFIKHYIQEIKLTIIDKSHKFQFGQEIQEILINNLERQKLQTTEVLKLYTLKIIDEELDLFMFEKAKQYAPWISKYRNIYLQNKQFYPIVPESRIEERNQLFFTEDKNNLFNKLKKLILQQSTESSDRFFTSQMLLQYFYLNKNQIHFKDNILKEFQSSNSLDTDHMNFIMLLCNEQQEKQDNLEIYQNRFFQLHQDQQAIEIQVFISFLASFAYSEKQQSLQGLPKQRFSFIGRMIERPDEIQNIFIPFLANVKEDFLYHVNLEEGKPFKRWRCKNCKNIFIISDCGQISNHRSKDKAVNLGGMRCQFCNLPVGFGGESNSEQIDTKSMNRSNFSSDNDAQQSYIYLERQHITNLKIRKIKQRTLVLGHLIIHSILLAGFVLSGEASQKNFIKEYLKTQPGREKLEFNKDRINVMKELMGQITADWETFIDTYNYTDKKLQILLEYIILSISKVQNSKEFSYLSLKTQKGRTDFEQAFERFIPQDDEQIIRIQRNFSNLDSSTKQLCETEKTVNLNSLLRKQKEINLQSFLIHLQSLEDEKSRTIVCMVESKAQLTMIKCLKPLLQWALLVLNIWNNKLTFEQSLEMSIRETIQKMSEQNIQSTQTLMIEQIIQCIRQFLFGDSSILEIENTLQDKIIQQIKNQPSMKQEILATKLIELINEENKLEDEQQIELKGKLTSLFRNQASQIQESYILKKFYKFQDAWNKFENTALTEDCDAIVINKISLDSKFQYCCITNTKKDSLGFHYYLLLQYVANLQNEFLQRISLDKLAQKLESKTDLMKLRNRQIIQEDISPESASFIINDNNSFNEIKYGEGTKILYDVDQIVDRLEALLLSEKSIINLESQVNFEFTNVGNPFGQFDNIKRLFKQTTNDSAPNVINSMTEQRLFSLYNEDLRTTMNLLQQTGGTSTQPLIDYMKAFGLKEFEKEIIPSLQLQHFLHFFNLVEGACADTLILKTDIKFKQDLANLDLDLLQSICKNNFITKQQENEDQLMQIKRILQRLCIRQLFDHQQSADQQLFPYIFNPDINDYLYDINSALNLQNMIDIFSSCKKIQLKNAYDVLGVFKLYEEEILSKRRRPQSPRLGGGSDNYNGPDDHGGDDWNFFNKKPPMIMKEPEPDNDKEGNAEKKKPLNQLNKGKMGLPQKKKGPKF